MNLLREWPSILFSAVKRVEVNLKLIETKKDTSCFCINFFSKYALTCLCVRVGIHTGGTMNIYKTWLICSTAKCGQGNCVASSPSWVVKDYLSWKSAFGILLFFLPGFEHRPQMKVGTHNCLTSWTDYTHARTRTHIYSSSECRFR